MPSIFTDEWRDCLRAHYTYVVRMSDHGTEKTLRGVMYEAGFSEDEVKQLYLLATAHVDDVGVDFVPDLELFEEETAVSLAVAVAVPEQIIEVELIEEALESSEESAAESDEAEADAAKEEPPPKSDPDITQLSLF